MYTLDTLFNKMRPYKVSTDEIEPIKFIIKSEKHVFEIVNKNKVLKSVDNNDNIYTINEKNEVRKSLFISIIKTHPKINIYREVCLAIDKKGGIVTHNNIYRPGQGGLYKYTDESIKIVTDWLLGFNLIRDVDNELNTLSIEDIYKIIPYINELKLKRETNNLERNHNEFFTYKGVKIDERDYYEGSTRH